MDVYQLMNSNPCATLIVVYFVAQLLMAIFVTLPNRMMRHWNIRKHGYPPAHCDADGDFKTEESE